MKEQTEVLDLIETTKAESLITELQKIKRATDTLKKKSDQLRAELMPIVEHAGGALETDTGMARIDKGRVSKRVDYAGLKGFSPEVYKRFVKETQGKPTLKVLGTKK